MPAGRPTIYSKEMLKKTLEYINSCEDDEYDYEKTIGEKSNSYEKRTRVNLPSIEGLAFELSVHKDTLYEWEDKYEEFSDALNKLRAKQARVVLNKGLSGDYNPTIAKLILSNNHGYKEKSETDVTTKGEKINDTNLDELAERMAEKLKEEKL